MAAPGGRVRGIAGGRRPPGTAQPQPYGAPAADVPFTGQQEENAREGGWRTLFPNAAHGRADADGPWVTPTVTPLVQQAKRLGHSWWFSGLGGGTVTGEDQLAALHLGRSDTEVLQDVLCDAIAEALSAGRLVSTPVGEVRADRERPPPPWPSQAPCPLNALTHDLKRRLALLYFDPRSLAALACTCRTWRAVTLGPKSLWGEKLALLQLAWPAAKLDDRMLEYYSLQEPEGGEVEGGTLWMRRYARLQSVANKLSVTASCDVAGNRGFHARLFTSTSGEVKTGWDVLPGEKCGSAFPNVALCRRTGGSAEEMFHVTGTMTLPAGSYLLRWRVRTTPGKRGASEMPPRPALWVSATAAAVPMSARSAGASTAAKASASTAAGLATTSLVVATAGIAAPVVVMAAALGAAVAAGGAVAATVASNAFATGAGRNTPGLLLPAVGQLLMPGPPGSAAVTPDDVRAAINDACDPHGLRAASLVGGGAPQLHVEGLWRLDEEAQLPGWRYVPVAFLQLATTCVVRCTMEQRNSRAPVCDVAVDYAEMVALHEDVFRVADPNMDPVNTQVPAAVQFGPAIQQAATRLAAQGTVGVLRR
jgi:hypothetical protein